MRAINSKVEQEQLRQAADNKLKTVESEQKQKVAIAEAEASAGQSDSRWRGVCQTSKVATAEAESLKIQNAALVQSKRRIAGAATYYGRTGQRRIDGTGRLPTSIYAGAPIPFLNVK